MAAVTQTTPNFLGGVSKQIDQKKLPGQVRECLNAMPDPTFGLMKRPGFKFIENIYSPASGNSPELVNGKWFFIKRDETETYIGCILNTATHTAAPIKIWNKEGVACTVLIDGTLMSVEEDGAAQGIQNTYTNKEVSTSGNGTGMTVNFDIGGAGVVETVTVHTEGVDYKVGDTITIANTITGTQDDVTAKITRESCSNYLNTTVNNYDVLTVQDTSIITNKTKVVAAKAAPTALDYVSGYKGTVRLKNIAYSCKYQIKLKIGSLYYGTDYSTSIRYIKDIGDADASRTEGTYLNVASTGGANGNATFNVVVNSSGGCVVSTEYAGTGYAVDDVITIADSTLGSGGGADLTLKVAEINDDLTNNLAAFYTTLNAESLSAANAETNPKDEKYNTADRILKELKEDLESVTLPANHVLTVTKLASSLELQLLNNNSPAAFEIEANDSQGNSHISAFNERVTTTADLPAESVHGRKAKVVNIGGAEDDYWSHFVAENGVSGLGFWEETRDPLSSEGMDPTTLPHELFNNALNSFHFRQPKTEDQTTLAWKGRYVGDSLTNSDPSFVGATIQKAFYHNSRLGFLTKDNVSMSRSNDFFNFYYTSALTSTDSDPIDINCSSIRPTSLNSIVSTAQGLILFSQNQQFIMFSDAEILTPSSATIRGISNYEMDPNIDPVEVGTQINFISKTPSYTRIFGMQTRGSEESPSVHDVGKVVSEWVPSSVTDLVSSPQNSLIALYGSLDNKVYLYKTYIVGDKVLMQAWFNWELPGNVQHLSIDSDTMWTVIEDNGIYHLISTSLTQTPEETIMTTADGQQINPHMDMYTAATNGAAGASEKKVVYDTAGNFSKCYIPYANLTTLNPVILIAGNATQDFAGVTEYGFTVSPDRNTEVITDNDGTYFKVPGKDLSASADNVYVGYKYNYDVELPKIYYKLNQEGSHYDYTAALTVARFKLAVGLSSVVGFKVKNKGYKGQSAEFSGDGSKTAFKVPFLLKEENGIRVTLDGALQPSTAYSITRTVETDEDNVTHTIDNSDTVTFLNIVPAGDIPASAATVWVATPAQKIEITTDTWYDVQPVIEAGQYLADDVPLSEENIFTIPIHQRNDNFNMRVFSDSPFPVSLTSLMWEGQYSPRFYRRT